MEKPELSFSTISESKECRTQTLLPLESVAHLPFTAVEAGFSTFLKIQYLQGSDPTRH